MLTKARPKTLYVSRPLLNAKALFAWAQRNGFEQPLSPDDMHVTIAFSRKALDWSHLKPKRNRVIIPEGYGVRKIASLGDEGAVVLLFSSNKFELRWIDFCNEGASWDYDDYHPHVTLTYYGDQLDLTGKLPYRGELVFGPEVFAEVDEDWKENIS